MTHPLYVAFIWHQHQPDYRDPCGGPALLPWARLHAAKDYVHMAELVNDFPAIHCTFNFVPSLVDQLAGIGEGRYVDYWQIQSLQESWSPQEKQFLRDQFFSIHPRLLERYPGYVLLRDQRGRSDLPDSYFVDLAAWFNLAWIDPRAIARDPVLRALVDKGAGFSRAEVAAVISKQRELAGRVIPLHRELAHRGQIELSLSPYYHPILPLLVDQRSAREALPTLSLPATLFAHPEDASEQIRRARVAHRHFFDLEPHGLWPSEGAVSDALLTVLGTDFSWLASDEEILARSLGTTMGRDHEGMVTHPRVLYQPYAISQMRGPRRKPLAATSLIFRDHVLSDRIGFAYQYLSASDAVGELMHWLQRIRERIADAEHAYLVSIILDGENAWESYEDNGDPFFRQLYTALSDDPSLRTVTVSEFLRENPPRASLDRLSAGSWINGNFDTWIGEPAQNRAWDLLAQTREALGAWLRNYDLADETVIERAWDELYIAEGSDWYWWYSSHNNSAQNAMYDRLFREHLQNVYTTIGHPVPNEFKQPIRKEGEPERQRGITALIHPDLQAAEHAGAAWSGGGMLQPEASSGTMQQASTRFAALYFGYSPEELFFRIETRVDRTPFRLALYLAAPQAERVNNRPRESDSPAHVGLSYEIAIEPGQNEWCVYRAEGQEIWQPASFQVRGAVSSRVCEIAIRHADIAGKPFDTIGVLVTLAQDHHIVETLPVQGVQSMTLSEIP